ncbi:hypothetical protein BPOR_0109g00120 [Botrytis porri]|uniref:Uncharacterized protein n=1 Tax=Botrytis porri TaxID=87229 RepID=A0A4Z1KY79_9HELO|nr:hypothetical protein BPOR_0109g00120 [Botrytis porri]
MSKSVLSPLPTYGSSNPCLPPLLKASRSVALFLQKGETFGLVGYGSITLGLDETTTLSDTNPLNGDQTA